MNALTVGILDVNDQSALEDQSSALAKLTLNFKGFGDDSAKAVLDQVSTLSPSEVLIVNRYYMPKPEAVVYNKSLEDDATLKTADALASAFKDLTGDDLKVLSFSGELRKLSYDSVVFVDSTLAKSSSNEVKFELADISRRHAMSQRPDGGDPYSGLAVYGYISKSFVRLMKSLVEKK